MCPDRVSGMEIKRKNNHFVTAQLVEVEFKVHKHRCAFFILYKIQGFEGLWKHFQTEKNLIFLIDFCCMHSPFFPSELIKNKNALNTWILLLKLQDKHQTPTPNNRTQTPLLQVGFSLKETEFLQNCSCQTRQEMQPVHLCVHFYRSFVKRRICVSMGCTSVPRLCLCQGGCSAHTTWQWFKGCGNPSKIQITLLWGSQSNAAHGIKTTLRSQKTLMAAIHHGSLQAMAPEGELRELPHSTSARARAGLWNHPWDTGWEIGWV